MPPAAACRADVLLLIAACWLLVAGVTSPAVSEPIAFEGARLITGDGGAPVENRIMAVAGAASSRFRRAPPATR